MAELEKELVEERAGFSRRGFLKGLLAGGAAASLGGYEAVAQMVAGPKASPVRGWGVAPGLVRLSKPLTILAARNVWRSIFSSN